MRYLRSGLLLVMVCSVYWENSAAWKESPKETTDNVVQVKYKKLKLGRSDSTPVVAKSILKLSEKPTNLNAKENDVNLTTISNVNESSIHNLSLPNLDLDVLASSKKNQKIKYDNGTLNDIKPFLLFPILPFLFPQEIKENSGSSLSEKDEFVEPNEPKVKANSSVDVKPFIFFDFPFNIRQVPLNNRTDCSNDTKVITSKKIVMKSPFNEIRITQKTKRRSSGGKKDKNGFFDDFPLFRDSDLYDFFPKPDFFPDLLFHHKPMKKLSRRKRDKIKPDIKTDIKFFMDSFDEAFMRTKKELERSDPVLNFLRGEKFPLDRDKKETDEKSRESPMIIVDKIVKIGEFRVHDDDHDKNKKKKRAVRDKLRKDITVQTSDERDIHRHRRTEETGAPNLKNILKLIRQEELKEKKKEKRKDTDNNINNKRKVYTRIESKEITILPRENISFITMGNNTNVELKDDLKSSDGVNPNGTDVLKNLFKAIDAVKNRFDGGVDVGRLKRKAYSENDSTIKKPLYEDLIKNMTDVLTRFSTLVQELDDVRLTEKNDERENKLASSFDWTEKETLQNLLTRNNRKKRQTDYIISREGIDLKDKLSFLDYFLTATLPTFIVFAVILIVCFVLTRLRGRFCKGIFKPRPIFQDQEHGRHPGSTKKSVRSKRTLAFPVTQM